MPRKLIDAPSSQQRSNTMNEQNLIEEISMKDLEQRIEFSCCTGGGGDDDCVGDPYYCVII
jgi:hypothetical protein